MARREVAAHHRGRPPGRCPAGRSPGRRNSTPACRPAAQPSSARSARCGHRGPAAARSAPAHRLPALSAIRTGEAASETTVRRHRRRAQNAVDARMLAASASSSERIGANGISASANTAVHSSSVRWPAAWRDHGPLVRVGVARAVVHAAADQSPNAFHSGGSPSRSTNGSQKRFSEGATRATWPSRCGTGCSASRDRSSRAIARRCWPARSGRASSTTSPSATATRRGTAPSKPRSRRRTAARMPSAANSRPASCRRCASRAAVSGWIAPVDGPHLAGVAVDRLAVRGQVAPRAVVAEA